jgi:predicted secreted Zn-dependent protease
MMKPRVLLTLLAVPALLACSLLTAVQPTPVPEIASIFGDDPNLTVTTYEVRGSTAADLRHQMDIHGPVDPDGYRGDALTTWYINWNWPGYGTPLCSLDEAYTSYTITVSFPHWSPPSDAPAGLAEKWDAFTLALARHERQHVDNLLAKYPAVLPAIQAATCLTAEDAARAIVDEIRAEDLAIDERTNHGLNDGARFP